MSGKCSCIYNLRHDSHFFEAFNKTKVASREVASSIAFSDSSTGELWYNQQLFLHWRHSVLTMLTMVYCLARVRPVFQERCESILSVSQQRGASMDQAHLLPVQMELFWTISVTTAPYIVCPVLLGICRMYAEGDSMLSFEQTLHFPSTCCSSCCHQQ